MNVEIKAASSDKFTWKGIKYKIPDVCAGIWIERIDNTSIEKMEKILKKREKKKCVIEIADKKELVELMQSLKTQCSDVIFSGLGNENILKAMKDFSWGIDIEDIKLVKELSDFIDKVNEREHIDCVLTLYNNYM